MPRRRISATPPTSTTRRRGRRRAFEEPEPRANWNIFYQRGIAYERLKEWPKAEPNFRKALELYPDQPQVMNYLGYSWVDMNMNLDEAMDLIRKAVDLQAERRLHRRFARLGLLQARQVRGRGARARARGVAEAGRSGAQRPSRRRLLARRPPARGDLPVGHARDMKPDKDVLASVQKKLAEGLPPLEGKTAAESRETAAPAVKQPRRRREKKSEAAPAAPPTRTPIPAAYTVQRGQSLWSIAADKLGNGSRYLEILNLNPELRGDPGRIVPGQELKLPTPAN